MPVAHLPTVEADPRVLLVGKEGCHLCEQARVVVATVCADLGVTWAEASVLDDPGLADLYWEKIPVTIVDGEVVEIWGLDEPTLRAALAARTA